MLVAELHGMRVMASVADRGMSCRCPGCHAPVILKRGQIVIAHFAHYPGTTCEYAHGETLAHLEAKAKFHAALISRDIKAEVEFVFGDQRADVAAWTPNGNPIAFEFQNTPIGLEEINRRASTYAEQGIAQAWIPILNGHPLHQYPARPFERYAHALHFGRMWCWNPSGRNFWRGHFEPFYCEVEERYWYESNECGPPSECSAGGYRYRSKRWKVLDLDGPHLPEHVRIRLKRRDMWIIEDWGVTLPACCIADLVGADEVAS